MDIEVESSF